MSFGAKALVTASILSLVLWNPFLDIFIPQKIRVLKEGALVQICFETKFLMMGKNIFEVFKMYLPVINISSMLETTPSRPCRIWSMVFCDIAGADVMP